MEGLLVEFFLNPQLLRLIPDFSPVKSFYYTVHDLYFL